MSYSRGFLNKHVILWNPTSVTSAYGNGRTTYKAVKTIWANVYWTRGARALHNGAVDVYDTVMVRSDIHSDLTNRTRLEYAGKYYIIDSFNVDEQKNECQVTAHEITDIQAVVTE